MSETARQYWTRRYEEMGPVYVAKGNKQQWYDHQFAAIEPILRRHVKGPRVLDFGCGPGRFRAVLEEDGREYVGVDLIPGLGTEPLGEALPTGFDTAVAVMVLQHITDSADYLHWTRELHRCLVPGGRLIAIDHEPQKLMDAHMNPRGLRTLRRTARWRWVRSYGEYDGHWIAVLLKGDD